MGFADALKAYKFAAYIYLNRLKDNFFQEFVW